MKNLKTVSATAIIALVAISISLSGCYKETFDFSDMREDVITWEPDIAFPIVYSTLDAEEIISISDSTNIYQYDADNFISLIYRKRIFSQTVNDFFTLPQNFDWFEAVSFDAAEIAQFTANGTETTTVQSGFIMPVTGPGNSQLDKVVFQSGSMIINFSSDYEHSGTLIVSMPELRLNGTPFTQSYPINFQGGTVNESITVDLAGYEMDLDNSFGANAVPIDYILTLNQNPGGFPPTTANSVQIQQSFVQLRAAFADGDFGNFILDVPQAEVDLDLFQGSNQGAIYFEDPRFKVHITNTIGAEMQVNVDQLYASGSPGITNIDISSQIPGNTFTIAAAPAPGDSSIQDFYFTKDNSNIRDIINDNYSGITHDFSAEVNPSGLGNYNFARLNDAIEVIADIELPFYGYSDHFTIIDTTEVPFNEAEDFADNVEKALLRINTKSFFPLDGILKLYFADENYVVLDSVLTDNNQFLIRSGVVEETDPFDGNTFRVIAPTNTNNDIELDTARINSLFDSKYLLLAADLTTSNDANDNIKLFADDYIEVRIGLRVKLKASPSDINDF